MNNTLSLNAKNVYHICIRRIGFMNIRNDWVLSLQNIFLKCHHLAFKLTIPATFQSFSSEIL